TGTAAGPSTDVLTTTPGGILGWWTKIGDRYHFGAALHTPYAERYPTGVESLGYHTLGGHFYSGVFTFGGSVKVDRLIIGLSLSFGASSVRYRVLRDTALEAGSAGVEGDCGGVRCGLENPAAAERMTLQGDDYDNDYFG